MAKNTPGEGQTFEQKVSTLLEQAKIAETGEITFPDDVEVDEATKFAVIAEKRRRDTQAAYTKQQQETKKLKAQNEQMAQEWEKLAVKDLPQAQQDELENLKLSDPDKWRERLNQLEQEAKARFQEKVSKISNDASTLTEVERRKQVLEDFHAQHPEVKLDDDVIENDIPPRYTKQLENGEITFEQFIDKCHKFLTGGKVIQQVDGQDAGVTLDDVGGGTTPAPGDVNKDIFKSYKEETY